MVVEVGPGGGVLTTAMLEAGGRVIAWEVDPEWAFALGVREGLRLVVGDALELPWERLPERVLVTGNLPYNVATPLIERMLGRTRELGAAALMVQWEVGERLAAGPCDPSYGALSVLTRAKAEVSLLGRVARGAFRPPPKVDGALVGLSPRPLVSDPDWPVFRTTVFQAFAERRKTVRNSLASAWGREASEAVLEGAAVEGGRRAEQLGVEELAAIAEAARRLAVLDADGTILAIQTPSGGSFPDPT
jgi:16S rRNA (adenine1518-N6/adenine1519-N6)-dimethyltransferase